MSRLPVTLGVAAAVVALDQLTKVIAVATLEGQPSIQVLGTWLQLTFVRNPGAAFSLAGNYTIVISAIALAVSFFIVRTARTLTSTWWAVVLGGILGGALGNLIDRILRSPAPFRGHVVDFLELPNWPVFNVADMALVGSAILAVVLSIVGIELTDEQAEAPAPATQVPDASAADGAAAGPTREPDAAPGVRAGGPEDDPADPPTGAPGPRSADG